MSYIQAIPFDTSRGGKTPNLCLANVCLGYGIPNKYGSAWEAWQHTQQHPDRNVPAGLAVPLYYSYTATIDGVTANYGHINVQLPDGTVWSDGNIYASIDDYLAGHSPKFVGWGESINDFSIIQGEIMPGVTMQGSPASVSWDNGRIDVFVQGSDNGLYHKWYDQSKWNNWERIGDAASPPCVSSWAQQRLDIFFRGIASDLVHIYYPAATANGFSAPESLGTLN